MNSSRHNHFIREALKTLMRDKKLHYSDLALALRVSLPTVKRMMTKESIAIDRLTAICDWLEIEFYDLIALAKSLEESELQYLTVEQETFLVRSPQACRFLIEIMNFLTPARIAKKFGLNQKSVDLYLTDLYKAGLISRKSAESPRVAPELLRGPRPDGPLRLDLLKRYQKFVPNLIARELEREVKNLAHQPLIPSSETIAINGFNLTESAKQDLLRSLKDLRKKFADLERIQTQTVPADQLMAVTFVTLLKEGSVYCSGVRRHQKEGLKANRRHKGLYRWRQIR